MERRRGNKEGRGYKGSEAAVWWGEWGRAPRKGKGMGRGQEREGLGWCWYGEEEAREGRVGRVRGGEGGGG